MLYKIRKILSVVALLCICDRRHPKWPPSWILLNVQIYRKNGKIEFFFAKVVNSDIVKRVAAFFFYFYSN